MNERPILFNDEMVRAILDGRKTQTRRVVKTPPSWDCIVYADGGNGWWPYRSDDGESPTYDNNEIPMNCPYGQPGDRLWVREAWTPGYFHNADADVGPQVSVIYRADSAEVVLAAPSYELAETWERSYSEDGPEDPRWRPSIHMPRWASRILLEVVSVRVERLQEITEVDAQAEGVDGAAEAAAAGLPWHDNPRRAFRFLWKRINGPDSWGANPWVWVVEFKRVDGTELN